MKLIINACYGGFSVSKEWADRLGTYTHDDDLRYNAELISAIEAGENVNGTCASLKVVELPDNCTDHYINEYDGVEDVIYVVDGKLHWA